MKKGLKITFVVLFLGLIPMSCNWNRCGDLPEYKNFNILSFTINTTNIDGLRLDTSVYFEYDSVRKSIRVDKTQEVVSNQDFNLFNQTALACSPVEPHSVNFIKEISIISNSNFEYKNEYDTIKMGDDITNMFLINQKYYSQSIPIDVYLSSEDRLQHDERLYLKLSEKPYKETEVKFDIKIGLSDNVIQEFKDQVLKVK